MFLHILGFTLLLISLLLIMIPAQLDKIKKSSQTILSVTAAVLLILGITTWLTANEISSEKFNEELYTSAAEQGIDQKTADYIRDSYGSSEYFVPAEERIKLFLRDQMEKNKKVERVQLLEQGLKVHNEAVANAEGKLSGDLSCYTITFINEMSEQAEQAETVLDLDCGTSLISEEFSTIEEELIKAEFEAGIMVRDDVDYSKYYNYFGYNEKLTDIEDIIR